MLQKYVKELTVAAQKKSHTKTQNEPSKRIFTVCELCFDV